MRMRSTGLGKSTELVAEFRRLERKSDHLILHVFTTAPVHWHIRVAINHKDIFSIARVLFKAFTTLLPFLVWRKKGSPPPEDY